jgi:hypothetical protein
VRWVRAISQEGRAKGCGIEFQFLDDATRAEVLSIQSGKNPLAYIPRG